MKKKCKKCKVKLVEEEGTLPGADKKVKLMICPKCGEGEVDKKSAKEASKEVEAKNIQKALVDINLLRATVLDLSEDDLDKMKRKIKCDEPNADAMAELFFNQPLEEFDAISSFPYQIYKL